MKKLAMISAIFLATLAILAETEELEYDFGAGERLELVMKSGGHMKVEGHDGPNILVSYELSDRTADVFVRDETLSGGLRLVIDQEREDDRGRFTLSVSLPNQADLDFYTAGGHVEISRLTGKLTGKTMGGHLKITDYEGSIEAASMGGNVNIRNVQMDGSIKTMGGNVNLNEMLGVVLVETKGGNINYGNEGTMETGLYDDARVVAITKGGNINVSEAPAGAELETKGGNINVGYAGGDVTAETNGGNVTVKQLTGGIQASTDGGNVTVAMIGSDQAVRDVDLKTEGGRVTLTVPSDFSMALDLEIEVTRRGDYEIKAPFELERDNRRMKSSGKGVMRSSARVNGGENTVKIRARNGDIIIRVAD